MTKRVFYDGGEADTPAYDDRYVTLKPGKKAQVNATYQLGSPPPPDKRKKKRQSAKRGGTAPRTSPKARTRSDAAPPRKIGVFLKTKV